MSEDLRPSDFIEFDVAKKPCDWLKELGHYDASTKAAIEACVSGCPYDYCIAVENEPRLRKDGRPWGSGPG